ncbi:unnamed protein product, partial [marine sediment metagenome]
ENDALQSKSERFPAPVNDYYLAFLAMGVIFGGV